MRTYKVIFCLSLVYFYLSCGLLQRTTLTTDKDNQEYSNNTRLSVAKAQEQQLESQSLTFFTDSTNHDYQVQLWPKGPFKYSASSGFEGEAQKVLISGNVKGMRKGNGSTTSKAKGSSLEVLDHQASGKAKTEQSSVIKKSARSVWWVFGSLILLAVLLFYFLRLKF